MYSSSAKYQQQEGAKSSKIVYSKHTFLHTKLRLRNGGEFCQQSFYKLSFISRHISCHTRKIRKWKVGNKEVKRSGLVVSWHYFSTPLVHLLQKLFLLCVLFREMSRFSWIAYVRRSRIGVTTIVEIKDLCEYFSWPISWMFDDEWLDKAAARRKASTRP